MNPKNLKWVFLIVLALIWGSSFILIKKGLLALNPFQLGSLRIVFAAIFLLLIGFKSLKTIPHTKWKYIAITAICGTFFPVYLFAIAQLKISSTVSAILNSLTPLHTLVLGALFFGLRFQRRQVFGVVIGLAGTLVLIADGAASQHEQNYAYTLLVIIASLGYATNVNLLNRHLSDVSPLAISAGNFAVLLLPALIVLSFTGLTDIVYEAAVLHSIGFVAVLGVVGTGLANIMFFRMIQMSSPVFATSVTYLIPVVAFFWGLFDNEQLSGVQLLGACIVLAGVYLSAKR